MKIRKQGSEIGRVRRRKLATIAEIGRRSTVVAGMRVAVAYAVENPEPEVVSPALPVRPVQDEWGFYDLEQAGFEAVLRKLTSTAGDDADKRPSASAIAR